MVIGKNGRMEYCAKGLPGYPDNYRETGTPSEERWSELKSEGQKVERVVLRLEFGVRLWKYLSPKPFDTSTESGQRIHLRKLRASMLKLVNDSEQSERMTRSVG